MKLHEIANPTAYTFHIKRTGKEIEVWVKHPSATKWQGYIHAALTAYKQPDQTTIDQLEAIEVYVNPNNRKQGLGTILYDKVEQVMQQRIQPSGELSDDAIAFWTKRNPKLSTDDLEDYGYGSFDDYDSNYKIPTI